MLTLTAVPSPILNRPFPLRPSWTGEIGDIIESLPRTLPSTTLPSCRLPQVVIPSPLPSSSTPSKPSRRIMVNSTSDGVVLSAEQKKFYAENGYLLLKSAVAPADLEAIKKTPMEVANGNGIAVQDIQNDDKLFGACQQHSIVAAVSDLIGNGPQSQLVAVTAEITNAPSEGVRLAATHPLRQELAFVPHRPAAALVTALTAIERIKKANGAITIVVGSHVAGALAPHKHLETKDGKSRGAYGIYNYETVTKRVQIEMDAGDTILLHPLVVHGFGANRSRGPRRTLSCVYANAEMIQDKSMVEQRARRVQAAKSSL